MTDTHTTGAGPARQRLPWAGLIALATTGFITVMTEAMPAGILPALSADLGATTAATGQTVTVYAIGSAVAALPLTAATIGWLRRRLLLTAVAGFAASNLVTALSTDYVLTMIARFGAGVVAGLVWALLAGYARRMVAPGQQGKAMAIAMAGTPVALSIGVPAGTFLAGLLGWRVAFVLMTVIAVALLGWILAAVPAFPGTARRDRQSLPHTVRLPGVVAILAVILTVVTAHNILYNYIAPYLAPLSLAERVDAVLLVFGLVSLVSIWITAALIDRHLRALMLTSTALFAVAATILALAVQAPALVYVAAANATLPDQVPASCRGRVSGIVGVILTGWGPLPLPWMAMALTLIAFAVTVLARRHGFPTRDGRPTHASP